MEFVYIKKHVFMHITEYVTVHVRLRMVYISAPCYYILDNT